MTNKRGERKGGPNDDRESAARRPDLRAGAARDADESAAGGGVPLSSGPVPDNEPAAGADPRRDRSARAPATAASPVGAAEANESPEAGAVSEAHMPPLDPAVLGAWRGLHRTHGVITREVEQRLGEAGLPPLGWYEVLLALDGAPGHRLRHGELAEALLLSRSGMTRLVDRMEQAGFVSRAAVVGDRRSANVTVTDAGSAILARMSVVYSAVLKERFAGPLGVYAAGVRDALGSVVRSLG